MAVGDLEGEDVQGGGVDDASAAGPALVLPEGAGERAVGDLAIDDGFLNDGTPALKT